MLASTQARFLRFQLAEWRYAGQVFAGFNSLVVQFRLPTLASRLAVFLLSLCLRAGGGAVECLGRRYPAQIAGSDRGAAAVVPAVAIGRGSGPSFRYPSYWSSTESTIAKVVRRQVSSVVANVPVPLGTPA